MVISRRSLLTQVAVSGGALSLLSTAAAGNKAPRNHTCRRKPVIADVEMKHLERAISLSNRGDYPYGALIRFQDGREYQAWNTVASTGDPTRHAEMTLFSKMFASDIDWIRDRDQLRQATLYTSAEPCTMCAGAVFWAGIGRVVHGVSLARLDEIYKKYYPDTTASQLHADTGEALHAVGIQVCGPHLEAESEAVVRQHLQSRFTKDNPFD